MDIAQRFDQLLPHDRLNDFVQRWRVRELSLFGSVLRHDYLPDSVVEVLISFAESAPWSLWDLTTMAVELSLLAGRKVDWVEKESLLNSFRRAETLKTRKVIYASQSYSI
ncbi:MAG: nucleotidyltransferase domain-containing protein [Pirellulales bacterium]|nr:nucleotidyltransferase domain-containing protein [Pirellulales bacterium]